MAKRLNGKGEDRYQGLEPVSNATNHLNTTNYNQIENNVNAANYNQIENNVNDTFEGEESPAAESLIKTYIQSGSSAYNSQKQQKHQQKHQQKNNHTNKDTSKAKNLESGN